MTSLCGQRNMGQGRPHVFSSARNIDSILLAHVGEAVSFVVCATKEPRQPPSHCCGAAFHSRAAREARRTCSARSSEVRTQGHLRGSACSGLGVAPATLDSWLARAKCDRGEWPEGVPFPKDREHGLPSSEPTGQALGWPFWRKQLSALDNADLPSFDVGTKPQA